MTTARVPVLALATLHRHSRQGGDAPTPVIVEPDMNTQATIRRAVGAGAIAAFALAAPAQALPGHDTQPLITVGTHAAVHALPWQTCASDAVLGAGLLASANSPATVVGDCVNDRTVIRYQQPGTISILDGTAVDALPWQFCGSNVVGGLGATVVTRSPKLVDGNCTNASADIAPAARHTPSLLSVLSGSSIQALPWQTCGSTAVAGVGVVTAVDSPTTVTGDCTNASTRVAPAHPDTLLPVLSGVPLTVLPLQTCEDTGSLLSPAGTAVSSGSNATVTGRCIS